MFEKEAEEAGNEKIKGNYQFARCARKSYKDGFKDGAELGYTKANEWHFVKDVELKDVEYPTHSNRVLVLTDEGVGFGIYGLDNKKWYTYDTGFDVIAWKEITLPALPNEVKEK